MLPALLLKMLFVPDPFVSYQMAVNVCTNVLVYYFVPLNYKSLLCQNCAVVMTIALDRGLSYDIAIPLALFFVLRIPSAIQGHLYS